MAVEKNKRKHGYWFVITLLKMNLFKGNVEAMKVLNKKEWW